MNTIGSNIDIIPFSDPLAHHFTELNIAWLEKYFQLEPMDRQVLGAPRQFVIERGGCIFFATLKGTVAGTFALLKHSNHTYELSKMAVAEKFQGMKVGNRMMEYSIEKAAALGARKIILYSNTILLPAIHLYKKYGFKEVPLGKSDYIRSNIKMERVTPQL